MDRARAGRHGRGCGAHGRGGAGAARAAGGAGEQGRRAARPALDTQLASRPGSANDPEVRPVRAMTIGQPRQLRLELPMLCWPDEVWAAVPEPVRAEVLGRLARLLARCLEATPTGGRP